MGLFSRDTAGRGSSGIRRADMQRLREWIDSRSGVELFVEPASPTSSMTMLLIAGDGESLRQHVNSAREAADFARKVRLPVYDTNRVGIPQRKRDYDVRKAKGEDMGPARPTAGVRAGSSGRPGAPPNAETRSALAPAQRAAVATLVSIAAVDASERPEGDELHRLVRQARARAHPDRNGGDRAAWDRVEQAVRTLGL